MKSFAIHEDTAIPMDGWQLKIKDTKTELEKLWLVVSLC